jgi:hypothetical protein
MHPKMVPFPNDTFTKSALVAYKAAIAPQMLPLECGRRSRRSDTALLPD